MNREEKAAVIESLKQQFQKSAASFLVDYKGASVSQLQKLRADLRQHGGRFKVAKARLMKLAAQDSADAQVMMPFFKEQVALVFADDEAAAVAKVLKDFVKEHKALSIVVGSLEQQLLDKDAVERIASLPSKEVLLGLVCGQLKAPITAFVFMMRMMQLRLLWTLKRIEQQKQ